MTLAALPTLRMHSRRHANNASPHASHLLDRQSGSDPLDVDQSDVVCCPHSLGSTHTRAKYTAPSVRQTVPEERQGPSEFVPRREQRCFVDAMHQTRTEGGHRHVLIQCIRPFTKVPLGLFCCTTARGLLTTSTSSSMCRISKTIPSNNRGDGCLRGSHPNGPRPSPLSMVLVYPPRLFILNHPLNRR